MRKYKYYKGETKKSFLQEGETIRVISDYTILIANPKVYWWWFEFLHGHMFDSVEQTVENFAYKHSDYAPLREKEIVDSYHKNAVCQ